MYKFPRFKKINVHDRGSFESMVDHHHHYYSTFNFTNLWAWDVANTRMFSMLNDNLVLLFTDYDTREPYFVFLGTHKPVHTAVTLLKFAHNHGVCTHLRHIPDRVAETLAGSPLLTVTPDRDSFDYVYSTKQLADLNGSSLKSKKMLVKRFVREHPDALLEINVLDTKEEMRSVIELLDTWKMNKKNASKDANIDHEEKAIHRLIKNADKHRLLLSSVKHKNTVIGFSLDEMLPHGKAIGHFIKGDIRFKGIYEFLNERIAGYLYTNGVTEWNWQQDLGLPGLRRLKESYQPIRLLKKYKVSLKHQS